MFFAFARPLVAGLLMLALASCCIESDTFTEFRYTNNTSDTLTLAADGLDYPIPTPDTVLLLPGETELFYGGLGSGKQSTFNPAFYYADSILAVHWTASSGATVTRSPADSSAWQIERIEERCVVTFRCALEIVPADLEF